MFHEEYTALCNAGVAKNNLLKKNPLGYFISSMVAGMFISFGSMVAFVPGQSMDGNGAAAAVKLIQSIAFASALSLVVMAGAELFTGNGGSIPEKESILGGYCETVVCLLDRQSDCFFALCSGFPADRTSDSRRWSNRRLFYQNFFSKSQSWCRRDPGACDPV